MTEGASHPDRRPPPEPPDDAVPPAWQASLGIVGGAVVGGLIYAGARWLMPPQVSVAAVLVGLSAGVSARLVRAIGTPAELRILIFGTLLAAVGGEYLNFARQGGAGIDPFTRGLAADPAWLFLTVFFVTAGIFLGVRVLVGNDPLGDLKALERQGPGGLGGLLLRLRPRGARTSLPAVPAIRPEPGARAPVSTPPASASPASASPASAPASAEPAAPEDPPRPT